MDRLSQLLEFLEENPNDSFIRFALALEYMKKEDYENALKYFELLIDADPNYVGTYYHLGKLYQQLDRNGDADTCYRNGIVIAEKLNDRHAYSELMTARNELVNDFDVEFDE